MTNQFYDIKELSLSHSSRSMYRSCARKLEMRKFFLHNKKNNAFTPDTGTALHTGYQEYLMANAGSSKFVGSGLSPSDSATIAMMLDYPVETRFDDARNSVRSLEACFATLQCMIASDQMGRYEIAKIKCLDGQIRLACEVPFQIDFIDFLLSGGVPVSFTGWIDLILFDRHNNKFIVVDIKTHRQAMMDLTAKYNFDEQPLPYGIVLENIQGHPIDYFEVSYMSCYIDLLEPTARYYAFDKTRDMIQDWAQGVYYDLTQINRFYETGWFPRATSGDTCMAYNKKCQFYDECEFRDHDAIKRIILAGAEPDTRKLDRRGEWAPWIKVEMAFGI